MKQEKKRDHEERENQDSLDNPRKRVKEDIKGEEYTPFLQEVLDVKGEDEESQHLVLTPPQPGLGTEQTPEQKLDPQFLEYWNTYGSEFLKGAASPEEAWQNCYMWYYHGSQQQQESHEEPLSGYNQQDIPEEKPSLTIPDSTESEEVIREALTGIILGEIVPDLGKKTSRMPKRDLKKGVDLPASRKTALQVAKSNAETYRPGEAYLLLTRWNKYAPDHKIAAEEIGLPSDFKPESLKQEVEDEPEQPEQRSFSLAGQNQILTESGGVKGGYHKIFDVPNDVFGRPTLVRAPRSQNPRNDTANGMANARKVQQNFKIPAILNDPTTDGFYVVEKVPHGFDPRNNKHREQIIDAFVQMKKTGSSFPFDLRVDNVRFRDDNTMVVIDFSESGGLCGDEEFQEDSLLELCWLGTKTKLSGFENNDNSDFSHFFNRAKPRIPLSMSRNPIDYDQTLFYDVQEKLEKRND